jgi:hypothetical protein
VFLTRAKLKKIAFKERLASGHLSNVENIFEQDNDSGDGRELLGLRNRESSY